MLQHTFVHIPGIGAKTEQELWDLGVRSWEDATAVLFNPAVPKRLIARLADYIPQSIEAMRSKRVEYFERLADIGEAWRLFPEFSDQCLYLDIETTGLSPVFDKLTMVGMFDGKDYKVFIDGENLEEFPRHFRGQKVLVTYNGSGFDLRFLKLAFPSLELPRVHIDLRWAAKRLGYKGGLKALEESLDLKRSRATEDLVGYDAAVLWSRYVRGDKDALELLIEYNTEDVVNLRPIMEALYRRLATQTASFLQESREQHEFGSTAIKPSNRVLNLAKADKLRTKNSVMKALLKKIELQEPRVVGIDLTGSEKRATGWALLMGDRAETKLVRTDDELVRETIAAKPDIVSIDSPLSLPGGGTEPRPDYPIYRKCELALKRMGISVFWALLPSMKMLTMRGRRLAGELRANGLKVIESYPGAAQDILQIPRKGSSLEELKLGLGRAGIRGEFLTAKVSHDELDAITSALVGVFFLANDFIALGTKEEDYLIVPRSPSINYERLAKILAESDLDPI